MHNNNLAFVLFLGLLYSNNHTLAFFHHDGHVFAIMLKIKYFYHNFLMNSQVS